MTRGAGLWHRDCRGRREVMIRVHPTELQRLYEELQEAIRAHAGWHRRLISTLVCRLPPPAEDLSPDAHLRCTFGVWFRRQGEGVLRGRPVYEEIDALRTLEINPVRYLAMPRLIACVFAVPALVIFADAIGILGGGMVAAVNPKINVPFNVYYDNLVRSLDYKEVCKGLIKSFVFGGIIAQVGCYVGFKTSGGARGIGESTTRSVVVSFLLIMVANYFLTRLML
jgi:hypothetical protein